MDQYVIRINGKSHGKTNEYNYAVNMYFTAIRTFPNEIVTLADTKNNLIITSSHKNHGVKNTSQTGEF